MATANITLILHLRNMNRNNYGRATYSFKREQRTLAIILVFFGLSYLIRFIWDAYLEAKIRSESIFEFEMVYDLVNFADGVSFAALLLFHNKNFKMQKGEQGIIEDNRRQIFGTMSNDDDGSVVYLDDGKSVRSTSLSGGTDDRDYSN